MPEQYEDLREAQQELFEWQEAEFPDSTPELMLIGVQEEIGELGHAYLKQEQGIRKDSDKVSEEAMMDAVGDTIVFLMQFCSRTDLDIGDCLEMATDEVLDRHWTEEGELEYRSAADD